MIYSYASDTSTTLGRSYDLLLWKGLEVLIQLIPIYLVSLTTILMYLYDLFLSLLAWKVFKYL